MKGWIWYRSQNRIENYYDHHGEQLGFYKKVHIKTQSKKKNVFVIFTLQETNEFPFIWQKLLKKTSNCIFNMEKVDLEEL